MRFKTIITAYFMVITLLVSGCDHSWVISSTEQNNQIWPDIQKGFKIPDASSQPEVKEQIKFYQQHPHILVQAIEPAKQYLPYIAQAIKSRGLPTELALLPIVESSYDPFAHSRVGASGLWQIMPGTATNKHIKINHWYDGRRDLIDSTRGALDHLTYLYDLFHDWPLALAAYDAGEGRVSKAISEHPSTTNINIFDLKLPKETMGYVPKLLAIKAIIANPKKYQIVLPPIEKHISFSTIQTNRTIDIKQLAASLQIDEKKLRAINPGLRRTTTEPGHTSRLLIPNALYTKAIQVIFNSKPTSYQVKSGDNLSSIAKKFKTTVSKIMAINNLPDTRLKIGQKLMILKSKQPTTPHKIADKISGDKKPGPKQKVHVVQAGDNLSKISKKYKVPKSHLIYWNHLTSTKLNKGQKIIIWLKFSEKLYIVKPGDSLSLLAKKHHTNIKTIKSLNHLTSNQIKIGQTLKIPS
jgi:membrane-bound lytic murein transglycosylase D